MIYLSECFLVHKLTPDLVYIFSGRLTYLISYYCLKKINGIFQEHFIGHVVSGQHTVKIDVWKQPFKSTKNSFFNNIKFSLRNCLWKFVEV